MRPFPARLLALSIVLALLTAKATAGETGWPHLRGPNYNGVSAETGIAESWPKGGPPVLWRIELGDGYSGFAAVGSRLYTQYQSLAGQRVVCLDADTGERIWRRRYGYPWQPDSDWPGPMATPTLSGGKVYFAGAFGLVGCLDAQSGRLLWSVNVTEKFEGEGTEYGCACSPLVEDGRVYLPVGGRGVAVVALSAEDGSVVWQSGDYVASYSPAYPITVGGRRQIVTYLRNDVVAFDAKTGRELWSYPWSKGYDEHAAWPVYEEPYLLTASAFRQGAKVLRLGAGTEGATADLVWKSKELSNDIFSSVILDGHIYGFDLHDLQPRQTRRAKGRFKCIKLATGEVCWSTDRTGHTNVLAADGKLILFNEAGELILARATPERYEEFCRAQIFSGQVCWTSPTLHRGRLYVRNHVYAACIYLGQPDRLEPGLLKQPGAQTLQVRGLLSKLEKIWRGSHLYAPTAGQMLKWYGYCVGVIVAAGILALLANALVKRSRPRHALVAFRAVFWGGLFVLGAAGTPVLTFASREFVFTWPSALFAVYQAVLVVGEGARKGSVRERYIARASVIAFACLCFGYYHLCRSLFVVMGYGFLVGILPAFPVAIVAARRMVGRGRPASDLGWAMASFSVYFWASALFTIWKTGA